MSESTTQMFNNSQSQTNLSFTVCWLQQLFRLQKLCEPCDLEVHCWYRFVTVGRGKLSLSVSNDLILDLLRLKAWVNPDTSATSTITPHGSTAYKHTIEIITVIETIHGHVTLQVSKRWCRWYSKWVPCETFDCISWDTRLPHIINTA